jgi:hypothetical protein
MADLLIEGVDEDLYAQLDFMAASENRTINQQILFILKAYLAIRHQLKRTNTPAQVLLDLSGSWKDDRTAEQIVRELKAGRKNS